MSRTRPEGVPADGTARRARGRAALASCALVVWAHAGCASYSELTARGRASVADGSYDAGIAAFNRALGVDDGEDLPAYVSSKDALLLLERGMVLQADGRYAESARDLGRADETLEYFDIATDAVGTITKYVFSDSLGTYKASPVEKLALNSLNMLNFLALDDLEGARVEAKRFTVMREYLEENAANAARGACGSYLAGFVFERLGDANAAMRYYDEALAAGDFVSLVEPIGRLSKLTPYRGKHVTDYLKRYPPSASGRPDAASEILTVVGLGRVPFKVPERMPIGAAIGIAGSHVSGDRDVLGYTALKVIVYPELQRSTATYTGSTVSIDDQPQPLELATDFGAEISAEYEQIKPKIIGAALSRLIVRAAAAEGAREAGKQAGGDEALIGWIAALLTEATLVALDKPDTRSWTLVPERVYVSRTAVSPGRHTVTVDLSGYESETRDVEVDVPAGGFAVIVAIPLR